MENNADDIFSYLITNEDFRDWVLKPNDERNFMWEIWIEEHPEAIAEVKKAKEFIKRMTFHKEELPLYESDEMLEKILANEAPAYQSRLYIQSRPYERKKNLYTIDQWVKVAAILIICIMSSIFIEGFSSLIEGEPEPVVTEWRKVENPTGRKSKITLPDGTMVMLNSDSEIQYPVIFTEPQRIVKLKGEAFFEVVRNEKIPFIIQTERMTTEVLGTSFNIKAYADDENQSVSVVSGKVKVSNNSGHDEILYPNEMGSIGKGNTIKKTPFDLKQVIGWKDGVISFKRSSLEEIEEKLSMWYGVDFIKDEGFKMDSVYTGEFVNETLENVMKGIAFSSGFKYKISEKKIYIYKQ